MKICCLLTSRGNNLLKPKNILGILVHPVLYYGADAAIKSGIFDKLYCGKTMKKF